TFRAGARLGKCLCDHLRFSVNEVSPTCQYKDFPASVLSSQALLPQHFTTSQSFVHISVKLSLSFRNTFFLPQPQSLLVRIYLFSILFDISKMHASFITAAFLPLLLAIPANALTTAGPVNATTTTTPTLTCGPGTSTLAVCIDYVSCGAMYGGCTSYCSGGAFPTYTPPQYVSDACLTWTEPTVTTTPNPSGVPASSGWPIITKNETTWVPSKPTATPKPGPGGDDGEAPPFGSFGARFEVGVMIAVPAVVAGVLGYLF
ncbi:hypothetical protein BJ508DRAFT_109297, partial [Ascobolus immersus RN42]